MNLKEHLKNVVKVENVDDLGLILFLENGNKISVVADNGGEMFYYLYTDDNKCLGMLF
ncbi:hypothetical protein [Bacillus phage vB_BanS-Thrax3]|nr:hypothetical protein [Bacillus phage vB_BanS-Thrax3]